MPAQSPYAIPHRNSFLSRSPSLSSSSSLFVIGKGGKGAALVAVFLFAIRFWKEANNRQSLWQFLRRKQPLCIRMIQWIQTSFGRTRPNGLTNILWRKSNDQHPQNYRDVLVCPSQQENKCTNNNEIDSLTTSRILENQRVIQEVLRYWFGQYTPELSQKMLWMIASSSVQLRKCVDKDITNKFKALLIELTETEVTGRWAEWCNDECNIYGRDGKIAAIIVLDQFSRHIQRYCQDHQEFSIDPNTSLSTDIPPQAHIDALALKTAKLLVEHHKEEVRCGMIPLPQYIFSLMPFRHASTLESVTYVQECIEDCASMHGQMDAMLRRFRKATNRRMAVLQDEIRRKGKINIRNDSSEIDKNDPGGNTNPNQTTTQQQIFRDEDILETFPFETDLSTAIDHPVHKTMVNFLASRGIYSQSEKRQHQQQSSSPIPVLVSLSGGVDSMVIASVLAHMHQECGYHLMIIAVHIDYANRPESGAEADYVKRFCEKLGITFRCRRIEEVTRGITARDDYERIARELRYDSYREAIACALEANGSSGNDQQEVGVMLGHHRGDLRENVLSNSHKGCGPLDLSGMTSVSKNDGITIFRPLLPLEKNFILEYAHKFGVPYFKDTTPHWSTRGKLRNKLLPLLQEIYGEGSMDNLSTLATESDECRALMNKAMFEPFLAQVVRKPMGIRFSTAEWKCQGPFFWKFVLRETLHSAGFGMFSDKSTQSFLERVQAEKVRPGWLQCRRDYAVFLRDNGDVFVFYSSSFPWRKQEMFQTPSHAEFDKEIQVGPWAVQAAIVNGTTSSPDTFRLAQKAVKSMDHLMEGQIEYFVDAPTWQEGRVFLPRPLIFCSEFTKASRPLAWKNTDLKVQSILPLLGNDDVATNALKDLTGSGLVHNDDNNEPCVNPLSLVKVTLQLTTSTS